MPKNNEFDSAPRLVNVGNGRRMGVQIQGSDEATVVFEGAGAGYGDLLERDPAGVIKDIEESLISQGVAERLYKVKFDPVTLSINHDATKAARRSGLVQLSEDDAKQEEWLAVIGLDPKVFRKGDARGVGVAVLQQVAQFGIETITWCDHIELPDLSEGRMFA